MKSKIGIVFLVLFSCLRIPCKAEAKVVIVGGLTHERTVKVGETYRGVIFVRNTDEEAQEAKLYQTDYQFFFDGRSIYDDPGNTPRSNADWIVFSPKRLTIPPQEEVAVNYTIKVPDDKSLVGTYWSMLMVEGISKGSLEASVLGKGALGIRQVVRYGIQMVTHIGGSGLGKLEFLDIKLLKEGDRKLLKIDIENIGERWLKPLLWVELYTQQGILVGRFEGGRLRIYPGTSVRYEVDLSEVLKGEYKALVVADCSGDDLFGASYTLKFER
jgi:hypothetical protein